MGLSSILASVLKGKVLAVVLVSTAIAGGATVAMAATPVGQKIVHHIPIARTVTPTVHTDHKEKDDQGTATPGATQRGKSQKHDENQECAGLPEVQRLATKFSLSTASQSDDVQAICSLHSGTFKGTTTNGVAVSTSRVYGYGEIEQLLTYAQFLAGHNKGNADGKLPGSNVSTYLADALHGCGGTSLEVCLKTNMPDAQPGNNGKGKGRPTSTPAPKH